MAPFMSEASGKATTANRVYALDALRGLAILAMLLAGSWIARVGSLQVAAEIEPPEPPALLPPTHGTPLLP